MDLKMRPAPVRRWDDMRTWAMHRNHSGYSTHIENGWLVVSMMHGRRHLSRAVLPWVLLDTRRGWRWAMAQVLLAMRRELRR